MRILLSAVGTRGDVQPVIALASNLRALGHEARLCVPPNFVEWAAGLGFEAIPVGMEMRAPREGGPSAPVPDLIADQFEVVRSAADGCDVILAGGAHQYGARSVAEWLDVPYVVAVYAPVSLPSSDLSPPGQADLPKDPAAIARLWRDNRSAWNARSLERVNANRARWNLGPIDDVLGHILADSPWLAADPILGPAPSTPGLHIVQTGAWIMEDDRALPPTLAAFLDAGEPPIHFGFGSMPAAQDTASILVAAARGLGRRSILSRGWAGLEPVDDAPDCIVIDEVNQQALFPRVAAVVHHGGSGTTTTAARAGVPQIAVPMFSDQFYWGQRLRDLGIGMSVPMAGMSRDTLIDALRQTLEPNVAARADALGKEVSSDGAAVAARRLVETGNRRRHDHACG